MLRSLVAGALTSIFLLSCMSQAPAVQPASQAAQNSSDGFFRPASLGDTRLKGVRFLGKTVSSIDRSLDFYRKSVPMELVSRYRIPADELFLPAMLSGSSGEIEVALVRTPTVFLQLVDFDPNAATPPNAKPVNEAGYTHICFQSPSSDSAFEKFRTAGLRLVSRGNGLVDLGGYGVRYSYGRDPDGTMIENEVVDRPRRSDAAWITHIGAATFDADRMSEFYTKFIGYGARRRGEYSGNPRIDAIADIDNLSLKSSWFVVRNLELEFWEFVNPKTSQRPTPMVDQIGYSMNAFEVTDVNAEKNRLEKLGIEIIGPAKTSRGWKILYARDPDGNIISIQQNLSAPKDQSIDDLLWIDPTVF